jgi:hypothetical protein
MNEADRTRIPTPGTGRRGAIAGAVAGTVVVLWFLFIDGIAGELFRTPSFLGQVLLGGVPAEVGAVQVVIYSAIHYAVFVVIGMVTAHVFDRMRMVPGLLLGSVLGFLLFDVLFYGSVWLTGVDVVRGLGWPNVLVANLLAGLSLVGTLRLLSPEPVLGWGAVLAEHTTVREGLIVGMIGAAVVAAWFLIIDLIAGRLLFTPAALGSVVFLGATGPESVAIDAATVLGYTALHIGAFGAVGLVAAAIVTLAEDKHPYVLLGAVLLFVTFETFFIGLITIIAQWLLEIIPWWSIAVANLAAAASMGAYLWKKHPALAAALGDEELERDVGREPVSAGPGVGESSGAGPGTPPGPRREP